MKNIALKEKMRKIFKSLGEFDEKIIWAFSVVILAGLFMANLIWTSHNAYDFYENVTIVRSFFNVPLLIITCIFIMWAAKSLLVNEKSTYILAGLTIIYVAAICYIILNTSTFIRADSKTCWEAAGAFLQGDFTQLQYDGYFTRFPFQLGLALYDMLLRLIWDNSRILYFFNIVEVLLIDWCGCQIAHRLFDNPVITRLTYLLELLFLPQFFMIMFGYGTIPGFACIMLAFYFFVCIYTSDKPSIKWLIFMVAFAILATLLKKNYSIALIAMAIMLFIKLLQQKGKRLYLLFAMCLVLILPLKAPDLVQAGFEAVSGITMEAPEPMIAHIAMGTDLDNTELGPGWYDGSTLWDYVNNDYDAKRQLEYEKEKLAKNIQASLDEPARAAKFYFHKVISEWCDPLFESVWSGPISDLEGNMYVEKPLLVSLYTGDYAEKAVSAFCKCMLIIILGAAAGFLIYRRKNISTALIFPLYLVGGFIFHLFSEAKSQYTYMYVFVLIPLAASGIYDLVNSKLFAKCLNCIKHLAGKLHLKSSSEKPTETIVNNPLLKHKKPVYVAQLIITLVLLLIALYKTYIPVQIDVETPSSQFNLPVGSYSATVDYQCGNDSKVMLSGDDSAIHANAINLSHLKNQVQYDFYVTDDVEDASLIITDCIAGDLTINKLTITTTGAAFKLLLFVWLLLIICIDFIFFARKSKKSKAIALIIFAMSIVTVIPLFTQGLHYGHDITFHLQRIEGIAQGLLQGQFPVRMNTVVNEGYGYPVDIFYGNLLLYVPAVLRLIGFSVLSAYKLYIWVVTALTLMLTYYCGKSILKEDRLALVVAFAYTTASYRAADIYNRAAVGEYTAIAFLPLVMLAFWKIYTEDVTAKLYKKNAVTLAFGMSLLVYTHVLSTEMTCITAAITALVFLKKTIRKETLLVFARAVIFAAALCLAYFVPFLDYYIKSDINLKHLKKSDSLIQSLGGYLDQYFAFFRDVYETYDSAGRMQITPGLCLMVALIFALVLIMLGRGNKPIYYFTAMSLFLLWLSSDIFPWDAIASSSKIGATFANVQYPWRYLAFASLFMAILLGLVLQRLMIVLPNHSKWQYLTILVAVALSLTTAAAYDMSYVTDVDSTHIYDTSELKNHSSDISQDEYGLLGTDYDKLEQTIGVNTGNASVVSTEGLDMVISVESLEATGIEIPRTCYPNYRATTTEGRKLNITTGYNNRVRIELPEAYSGTITVTYVVPWYWRVAEIVSLLAVVEVLLFWRHVNYRL